MDEFYELLEKELGSTVTDEKIYTDLKPKIEKIYAESVAGLKATNDKLKNEKMTVKGKLESLETQLASLEGKPLADVLKEKAQLEKDIEELRANPGDATKLKQLEEVYKARIQAAESDRDARLKIKEDELADERTKNQALNAEINKTQCKTELSAQLDAVGVKPEFKQVVLGFLSQKVTVDVVEGIRKVKYVNDAGVSFDLKEGIEYWAKQPDAKPFIGAPNNTGGGATGSGTLTNALMGKNFADMTPEEKTTLYKVNPEVYKRKRDEYNAGK